MYSSFSKVNFVFTLVLSVLCYILLEYQETLINMQYQGNRKGANTFPGHLSEKSEYRIEVIFVFLGNQSHELTELC